MELPSSKGRVEHSVDELATTGIPLGELPGRGFPSGPTLSLEPDETVVLFTDGITESGVLDGSELGTDRLLQFIRDHRHDPTSHIVEGLCRTAQSFQADRPQTEDTTVVVCKAETTP